MGATHLNNLLRFEQEGKVRIAALCDCDENRLEAAWENTGKRATPYRDYRSILERKDIDAVLIATPDHWHCQMVLDAVAAKKDIYCEKGFCRTLGEAKLMRDALKKSGVVFQLGHQARESTCAFQAKELLAQDILGLTAEQGKRRERAAGIMNEIRGLSRNILDRAGAEVETSSQVTQAMTGVTARAENITKLTSLQTERSAVLRQIIGEMSDVASKNAQGAAGASKTTEELARIADELGQLVEQFRISRDI
jgi:hypothetical protein